MQAVQRRFGKFLPRTADESQVAVLLKEFEDADKMLAKIIEASKAWRDSWRDILTTQQRLTQTFQSIYEPIVGASENYQGHEPVMTDEATLRRARELQHQYSELRADLGDELGVVEARIIHPAKTAMECIQPMKKVIKKREDRKLDFEKYQHRVNTFAKKTKRSDRDNASLEKAEQELTQAREDYNDADDRLKSSLPPVVTAAFSILPHLLANQIMVQNTLLAQYYTVLHGFSADIGYPDPPESMVQILGRWDVDFRSVRHHVETSIACIAQGKTVKQPLCTDEASPAMTRAASRDEGLKSRAASGTGSGLPKTVVPLTRALSNQESEITSPSDSCALVTASSPEVSTDAFVTGPSPSLSSKAQQPDRTSDEAGSSGSRQFSAEHQMPGISKGHASSSPHSIASSTKRKPPPPPPPPKRQVSSQESYAVALYDFTGQSEDDLSFSAGDRICIVKRTESTNDWWEGTLRGVLGNFPANYCRT